MQYLFVNAWQRWVELFGGLGLPWSKQATATAAVGVVFYFVGIGFKFLTSKER
jgi:hypothetical protein